MISIEIFDKEWVSYSKNIVQFTIYGYYCMKI